MMSAACRSARAIRSRGRTFRSSSVSSGSSSRNGVRSSTPGSPPALVTRPALAALAVRRAWSVRRPTTMSLSRVPSGRLYVLARLAYQGQHSGCRSSDTRITPLPQASWHDRYHRQERFPPGSRRTDLPHHDYLPRPGVHSVPRRSGSADLSYPPAGSPCLIGGPDVGIQRVAECHAEPIGERQSFNCPPPGCPLSIGGRHHRLSTCDPVADEQRSGQVPVTAMVRGYLRHPQLAAPQQPAPDSASYAHPRPALALQEREQRERGIEDVTPHHSPRVPGGCSEEGRSGPQAREILRGPVLESCGWVRRTSPAGFSRLPAGCPPASRARSKLVGRRGARGLP